MAVQVIRELEGEQFVIMSDSCSALKSLRCARNQHPICRKLKHKIAQMKDNNKDMCLCLIPSHIGIKKNEEADRAAVVAANGTEQCIPLYYRDWFPTIARAIEKGWNREWLGKKQKIYEIKVGPWRNRKKLTRREEVVLNRLRSGHTRLTHGYLMENIAPQMPPICQYCNNAIVTVKPLLICPAVRNERMRGRLFRENNQVTLKMCIGNNNNNKRGRLTTNPETYVHCGPRDTHFL